MIIRVRNWVPLVSFFNLLSHMYCSINFHEPRWVVLDPTDDESKLVQVMAWCHQTTSHFLKQCWPRSMSPYGITRLQWDKADLHSNFFIVECVTSQSHNRTTLFYIWIYQLPLLIQQLQKLLLDGYSRHCLPNSSVWCIIAEWTFNGSNIPPPVASYKLWNMARCQSQSSHEGFQWNRKPASILKICSNSPA